MRNDEPIMTLPRNVAFPIVLAIALISVLLAGAGLIVRPWFVSSFDFLDARGVGHADIDVLFRHTGFLAAILLVALSAIGALLLLRRSQISVPRLAWFSTVAFSSMLLWVLWLGLVLHNTYLALFSR
jgi:hypothetical protein